MLPSPAELQYFLEIANTQNISRAAERLGISQPTLSLAVRRLEDSIGVPLLIRTKSGVKLTKAGDKLVVRARSLVQQWTDLKDETKKDQDLVSGAYTVGCHPSVALYSLGFVSNLLEQNPGLEIKLIHDLSRKITEDVISFKIDFGIVVNPTRHPDLVIRPLLRDEVTFWKSELSTKQQDPFTGEGVLICDTDLLQTQSLLKQVKQKKMEFGRTITSSSLEVIANLVVDGAGIGILPGKVAGRYKGQGIKKVNNAPQFHDRICLVYRADAQNSGTGRYLGKEIERSFKATGK